MASRKRKIVMLMIEGSESNTVQARLISSSLALAEYLSADLEILVPDLSCWPHANTFFPFQKVTHLRVSVTSLGKGASLVEEVGKEIEEKCPVLFVLDRNSLAEKPAKFSSLNRQRILSQVSVPTLLLLCDRDVLKVPFLSILVPMSGEMRASSALEWSINFANEMNIPVDLLHVTRRWEDQTSDPSLIGQLSDDFYHEYPRLVSEFVAQGSPYSSMREKEVIRNFRHCTGVELEEILKCGCQEVRPLVVVEWKGNLGKGRAEVLKGILARTDWPILLTRQVENMPARLRRPGYARRKSVIS